MRFLQISYHFSTVPYYMLEYSEPVAKLIDEFKRLPGIGNKSAQRLAFHILRLPEDKVDNLVVALREVKEKIVFCSICNNLTDTDPCIFCSSTTRDKTQICIVEEPYNFCLLYTSPSPRDRQKSRMPSSA